MSDEDDGRSRWSTSVVLSDGDSAFIRPITRPDAALLLQFHQRQPQENIYKRFFSAKPTLTPKELDHFTNIDFRSRVALAVEHRGEWIGWASYERWTGRDDAEVAFLIDSNHQGRGIATILLEHLAAIARANGITRFTAEVLADNRAMLGVFNRAGFPVEKHFDSGLTELEFPLVETESVVDVVEGREHRSDSCAVARLLLPKSIAVVGASDRPGTIGHEIWKNTATFDGPVFAVNPSHETIGGRPAYASVGDIADDVWLAVIAVPAHELPSIIQQCISKRVRGAVLITAVDGMDVDMAALVAHARRNGLRLIGPASMGVATSQPGGLQGALVPMTLPVGSVAISMQSGSLGASLLHLAVRLRMGISWFVSLGDKCDISGNDLLQFWEDDDNTRVIAMYTESFGNPRKFARLARRVGRRKPIVSVRTGTAAIGHAASALYQKAGLIEVPTVRAMLDTSRMLSCQPVPTGPKVALLTNARSPGVLAGAAIVSAGLSVVDPPRPLDWRSTAADFRAAVSAAVADPGVDAIVVIHAPPIASSDSPLEEIDEAAAGSPKPVVAVMLGREDGPLRFGSAVPSFSFPEPAVAALGRMFAYSRWLQSEAGSIVEDLPGTDFAAAEALLSAVEGDSDVLTYDQASALLASYGIESPPARLVQDADDAHVIEVARDVGYPIVLKATRRHVGRSVRAGIALDLNNDDDVGEALTVMRSALGEDARSFFIQRMVVPGVDVRISGLTDAQLGPVITLDLGSMQSNNPDDGTSRLPPISRTTADAMITASPVGRALDSAGLNRAPLVDILMRVGELMFDHPTLSQIEIDPAIVSASECIVTDVRIEIDVAPESDFPLRRLG